MVQYATPLADSEVPSSIKETLTLYRNIAREYEDLSSSPLCYLLKGGFTLHDAPGFGPCYKDFRYIQNWGINSEPLPDAYAFWVPRLLRHSTFKSAFEQNRVLSQNREFYGLPDHHGTSFGTAALIAVLALAHYHATGERVPLGNRFARTDTPALNGTLCIGGFAHIGHGLECDTTLPSYARHDLGVFLSGVERV